MISDEFNWNIIWRKNINSEKNALPYCTIFFFTANWILYLRGIDFQMQISAYKFQIFITIVIPIVQWIQWFSLNYFTEMNDILNLNIF